MVRRFYGLPSLTALAAFEATARHGSLTLAAAELNVTAGAISRQIKVIEKDLETNLFSRKSRGVVLTGQGEELYNVLATGFARAADVVQAIRRGDRARNVTIACSDVFATMWLIPHMPGFWQQHADINVDHLISDNPRNFRRAEVELRIRFGLGAWIDESSEFLFHDYLYPVCSPSFAERHCGKGVEDLGDLPLLNVEWVEPDWIGWDEVLIRAGVGATAGNMRRFGKFSVALQAAMADQGIVVGWHRVVGPLIAEGKLVRFTTLLLPTPGGYYLTWNNSRDLSPAAQTLRTWISGVAEKERAAPEPRPL